MLDLTKLKKAFNQNMDIHSFDLEEENSFISFYDQKNGFYYRVNIYNKEGYIYLDFQDIYHKEWFNHERRVDVSYIAHTLKQFIEKTSKYRVRVLSGVSKVSWDWLIINNIEEYKKRSNRTYIYSMEKDILTLYENAIRESANEPIDRSYEYEFYLSGEDGFYLFEMMEELGIATLESKRKVDLLITFMPKYVSKKEKFISLMEEGLRHLGFQIHLYSMKKG